MAETSLPDLVLALVLCTSLCTDYSVVVDCKLLPAGLRAECNELNDRTAGGTSCRTILSTNCEFLAWEDVMSDGPLWPPRSVCQAICQRRDTQLDTPM
jgi:hypothetical protein